MSSPPLKRADRIGRMPRSMDLSKPHFTVVLDEKAGENAFLAETPEGEWILNVHPSVAEDGSPAHCNGRAMLKKAVEVLTRRPRPTDGPDLDPPRPA